MLATPSSTIESENVSTCWISRATWGFIALGIAIRLVRYLVVYPLWPDEAFVAANFLERDYLGLLRSLDFGQVSPFLFLWIELFIVRLFGFAEWSLRLFPAICGMASLLLFRHLAARFLTGPSLFLAVAIFATSLAPIRHGAEIKPYASDLLTSILLLSLAAECARAPERSRIWWILAGLAPITLAISHTAIFVAAGLSLALAPGVLRQKRIAVTCAFFVYSLTTVVTFALIFQLATSSQSEAVLSGYRWGYWRDSFPDWSRPWSIPGWLISMHAGNMMAYPVGGAHGASLATLAAVTIGAVAFWRTGMRRSLSILLAPALMGLAAAAIGRYPYGGSARITQYLSPTICILGGVGFTRMLERTLRPANRMRGVRIAATLLAGLGAYFAVNDVIHPYRSLADQENRRFARWLWTDYAKQSNLICLRHDLGLLTHRKFWHTGMSAIYLCYQRIYAGRHESNHHTDPGRAFQVVFEHEIPRDAPELERWLAEIDATHRIAGKKVFSANPVGPGGDKSRCIIVQFEPRRQAEQLARTHDPGNARSR